MMSPPRPTARWATNQEAKISFQKGILQIIPKLPKLPQPSPNYITKEVLGFAGPVPALSRKQPPTGLARTPRRWGICMVWFAAGPGEVGPQHRCFSFRVIVLCNRARCFHELHAAFPHRQPAAASRPLPRGLPATQELSDLQRHRPIAL